MRGKRSRAVLLAVALLLAPGGGLAQAPDGLYSARVHTTGQGEENRGAAFARGLADVLVKVSGAAALAVERGSRPSIRRRSCAASPTATSWRAFPSMTSRERASDPTN
jgi:hypothetical protein